MIFRVKVHPIPQIDVVLLPFPCELKQLFGFRADALFGGSFGLGGV